MIKTTKTFLSIILSVLALFSSFIFGNFNGAYEPIDKESIKLNFAAISDVHMNNSAVRENLLGLGLYDLENSVVPLDALVISGDITDGGLENEYQNLEKAFSLYNPAKNIILAEGNHDTFMVYDNYSAAESLFIEYNKKIANRELEKAYYSTEVNGYTFIVLASEMDWNFAYISDEQLEWLADEMEKAAEKDLPIFVVTHWPFNQTHGLPYTWGTYDDVDEGGFGYQSEQIEEILKKYDNVFMISGHVHNGFTNEADSGIYGYNTVENDGSFHSINLPSYMTPTLKGRVCSGTGYQFEVYSDKVVIRARCFTSGAWYTLYDYSFDLI